MKWQTAILVVVCIIESVRPMYVQTGFGLDEIQKKALHGTWRGYLESRLVGVRTIEHAKQWVPDEVTTPLFILILCLNLDDLFSFLGTRHRELPNFMPHHSDAHRDHSNVTSHASTRQRLPLRVELK